jgi:hypothetical protein
VQNTIAQSGVERRRNVTLGLRQPESSALKGQDKKCGSFYFAPSEIAEKVGFDDFYRQNTVVEKFHPHYFVGEILDFGLFQQSPLALEEIRLHPEIHAQHKSFATASLELV